MNNIQNRILHPSYDRTDSDFSDFYHKKCFAGLVYDKWMKIFLDNNINYEIEADIIKFRNYDIYTPYTYKFIFNFPFGLEKTHDMSRELSKEQYEIFADLFFTKGWEEELEYQLTFYQDRHKINKPNKRYSDNYGEIRVNVKPWIDYVTFQGRRTIIQFKLDKYIQIELRKEKLSRLKEL